MIANWRFFCQKIYLGTPRDVVANVLDSDIVVSELEFLSRLYVHFSSNIIEKIMYPLIPPLPASKRMAFELNDPWMLICH